jgi:hypothetical protein
MSGQEARQHIMVKGREEAQEAPGSPQEGGVLPNTKPMRAYMSTVIVFSGPRRFPCPHLSFFLPTSNVWMQRLFIITEKMYLFYTRSGAYS